MKAHLHISVLGKQIHSFHFFGAVGFLAGLALGIGMAIVLDLNPWVILLMTAVGAATFFLLVYLAVRRQVQKYLLINFVPLVMVEEFQDTIE